MLYMRRLLLKLSLIITVSARSLSSDNDKKDTSEKLFPANISRESEISLRKYIADNVCSDLYQDYEEGVARNVTRCKQNFSWDLGPSKSGFQMRCRTNDIVTIEVPSEQLHQLILLIPDPYNNNRHDTFYNIIKPGAKYEEITVTPDTNYSTFSTTLDNGKPSIWRREFRVTKWEPPGHRKYDLKLNFTNTSNSTDVLFTWNRTGELDSCFKLVARCNKIHSMAFDVRTDSSPSVEMKGLLLDDSCYAELTGFYGVTNYSFNTSNSNNSDNHLDRNTVKTKAEEAGDGWTVSITWDQPGIVPKSYNVTLRADDITSIVVPGNATEVTFKNITGKEFYNVSIDAREEHDIWHTSVRGFFPSHSWGWRWVGAAGGAWVAALAGVVAAMLCWLRFRSRFIPPKKRRGSVTSLPEENPSDSVGEESWTADVWEVKSERVLLHEVIGEGAFGVVRRGTLAPNGKEVAVKMLKDFPSLEEMRAFRLEMELMKSVGAHPHVVSLVGCCSGTHPLIVAEYCSRGDLLSFLRRSWDVMVSKRNAKYYNNNIDTSDYRNDLFKCRVPQEHSKLVVNKMYDIQGACETDLTPMDLLSFCRQIAMGMEFLASNRLVHRDLAARNILVTGDKMLKIADFGLSRDVYEENQYKQKGNGKMPVKWMALESLMRRIYTTQSDVWSFGVVVWEVVTVGGAPYPEVPAARLPRLLRNGYRMPRPHNCSKQLYDVMQSCWRARPRERPTFTELHMRFDELLNSTCADEYLSLELDDEPPPTPKPQRYFRMIIRAKRNWMRGESYERPLKAPHNHYTSFPVAINKTPV